ncbi:sulfatase-like hydrolase/transferase [Jannaschia formosa]|uniref:sulfatase-like hydrolase/transferase n=1 Tax=Jannaschia formosa TaxID=2259592 RepID=UPI00142F7C98|nr:sulfatase-like hydrolase/transferase [Jannaschia formosa]
MSEQMNLLILMADEHAKDAIGAFGHPIVQTPHLDRLVATGTAFTSAYTPSPLCVPARAAIATGRPVHEIGAWDNAHPYEGTPEGWAHAATRAGIDTLSIGKLHFRSDSVNTGFARSLLPMHVVEARGDILGSIRNPLPQRAKGKSLAAGIGVGETSTSRYDRSIADVACAEIEKRGTTPATPPWLMFVSFVAPHFPLTAPEKFARLYSPAEMPLPASAIAPEEQHPWFAEMRRTLNWKEGFNDDTRRQAVASYYGLTSFMDDNVGRVLAALDRAGLTGRTRVIYLSDHGEALGKRDLWGKSTLYEESAGVPLILSGPDVPHGRIDAPVCLTDLDATVRDALRLDVSEDGGTSLLGVARRRMDPPADVLSQFHGGGSPSAAYMIRFGDWKYVAYAGFAPQLFHLPSDPDERHDRSNAPSAYEALVEGRRLLLNRLDPDAVDREAKAAQSALVEQHGGREAIIAKGGFGATPPPGEKALYAKGK